MDDKSGSYTAFPLLMAQKYLNTKNINAEGSDQGFLRLGQAVFSPLPDHYGPYIHEDMGGYQLFLNYPSLHRTFPDFTLSQLIDGKIPDASLKDKIVLLGSSAPSLNDYKLLPGFKEPHFGVELHAHLVDQILQAALGTYPLQSDWPETYEYCWLFLWCFLGGLASLNHGGLIQMTAITLAGLAILLAVAAFFRTALIPLLPPALGWMLTLVASVVWSSNQERNERQQLLKIFEQHVSPQVATDLWENRDKYFDAGGVLPCQITATVFFSDLAGFTPISETMTPVALMSWLNAYMEEMSNIIMDENGMIKGYMGDGIMAVYGAPAFKHDAEGIKADALSAVASGLRINQRLKELNVIWQKQGLPPAYMRIGIHTGLAVAGTLGCKQRMEYAVTGETTITASRLESFDKTIAAPTHQLPCRILIGEPTWELVRDHYHAEKVGEFQLKGKSTMVNIYQVIS
jgi:adenylate cyclase